MQGIPPAAQPARMQLGLVAHRQQQRAHGLPIRCCLPSLDARDSRLRHASTASKRALTETETTAMLADDLAGIHIVKYIDNDASSKVSAFRRGNSTLLTPNESAWRKR